MSIPSLRPAVIFLRRVFLRALSLVLRFYMVLDLLFQLELRPQGFLPTRASRTQSSPARQQHKLAKVSPSPIDEIDACAKDAVGVAKVRARSSGTSQPPALLATLFFLSSRLPSFLKSSPFSFFSIFTEAKSSLPKDQQPQQSQVCSSTCLEIGVVFLQLCKHSMVGAPLLVWLCMPWETSSDVLRQFLIRLGTACNSNVLLIQPIHSAAASLMMERGGEAKADPAVTQPREQSSYCLETVASALLTTIKNAVGTFCQHETVDCLPSHDAHKVVLGSANVSSLIVLELIRILSQTEGDGNTGCDDDVSHPSASTSFRIAPNYRLEGVLYVDPFVGWNLKEYDGKSGGVGLKTLLQHALCANPVTVAVQSPPVRGAGGSEVPVEETTNISQWFPDWSNSTANTNKRPSSCRKGCHGSLPIPSLVLLDLRSVWLPEQMDYFEHCCNCSSEIFHFDSMRSEGRKQCSAGASPQDINDASSLSEDDAIAATVEFWVRDVFRCYLSADEIAMYSSTPVLGRRPAYGPRDGDRIESVDSIEGFFRYTPNTRSTTLPPGASVARQLADNGVPSSSSALDGTPVLWMPPLVEELVRYDSQGAVSGLLDSLPPVNPLSLRNIPQVASRSLVEEELMCLT